MRRESPQDEIFVKRVSKRIVLLRFTHRAIQISLAGLGVAILAIMTPWLMSLTGYITIASNLFAYGIVAMILSPVGWAIGAGAGLVFFLKARS